MFQILYGGLRPGGRRGREQVSYMCGSFKRGGWGPPGLHMEWGAAISEAANLLLMAYAPISSDGPTSITFLAVVGHCSTSVGVS